VLRCGAGEEVDLAEGEAGAATPIAVVDIATTGVYPGGKDRIIEVAVVRFRRGAGEVEDEYTTLVNPRRDLGRSEIHGITGADVAAAPDFAEIAGDVGQRLNGAIVAAHNVRFVLGFLRAEYGRLGIALPSFPTLCTLQLAHGLGGASPRSLHACCAAAGVEHPEPHTAAGDARACLALLDAYLDEAPGASLHDLGSEHTRIPDPGWITVPASGRRTVRTPEAMLRARERGYLSRLVAHLPSHEGTSLREAEYLCLLDDVLRDRALSRDEAEALWSAAYSWGMSQNDVAGAHQAFLWALVRQAKADGVVTDGERRDLATLCEILGADPEGLAVILDALGPTGVR